MAWQTHCQIRTSLPRNPKVSPTNRSHNANNQRPFMSYYNDDKNTGNYKAWQFLQQELTWWFNPSSLCIAWELILRLTKSKPKLFAPLVNILVERKDLYNNGVAMFYLMKELLLSAVKPIAGTLDTEMRNAKMAFAKGYPHGYLQLLQHSSWSAHASR